MSLDLIGAITFALGAAMLFASLETVFFILIISVLFQASAAIGLNGNTITPPHLLLGFAAIVLIVRERKAQHFLEALRFPNPGFWVCLLVIWCIISAMFLPRIFGGRIDVSPIVGGDSSDSVLSIPLQPTSGNLTQPIYIVGSFFVFLATWTYAKSNAMVVTKALILFSICNIVFAFIDLAGFWSGYTGFLDAIHNGNYVMHTSEISAGFHRISGSFSEAAAFSAVTLSTLPFTLMLYLQGYMKKTMLSATIIQLVLLFASTSTTAYVASAVVIFYVGVTCLFRLSRGLATSREALFLIVAPLTAVIALIAILLSDTLRDTVVNILETVILNKNTTDSAVQRDALNVLAIRNFFSTFGLGVGTGGARTSSFPLAVLANIGVIGAFLYTIFLISLYRIPHDTDLDQQTLGIRSCARGACFGGLVAYTISGTIVDLGLLFFIFAGLAGAGDSSERSETPALLIENADENLTAHLRAAT